MRYFDRLFHISEWLAMSRYDKFHIEFLNHLQRSARFSET
jgi:hypothetical protein